MKIESHPFFHPEQVPLNKFIGVVVKCIDFFLSFAVHPAIARSTEIVVS